MVRAVLEKDKGARHRHIESMPENCREIYGTITLQVWFSGYKKEAHRCASLGVYTTYSVWLFRTS